MIQKQLVSSPCFTTEIRCDVKQLQTKQGQSLSILTTTEWTHKNKLQRTSNVINVIPFSDDKNLQKHEDDSGRNICCAVETDLEIGM